MNDKDLEARIKVASAKTDAACKGMSRVAKEADRVAKVVHNTPQILEDLDEEFSQHTGLNKKDIALLFFAVALQMARQYLWTKFPQIKDSQTAADETWGHGEEHSLRHHRLYEPSLEEIITNPVPFDANIGANGALSGAGQMGHRVKTLGHDPILGLIFGTANIATSTLTTSDLLSYHIYTESKRDVFTYQASTMKVMNRTLDKAVNRGIEGKKIVAASLIKEIIHLQSDVWTKHSLPLPFVSMADPKFASFLGCVCGLNMRNVIQVGKQALFAEFINWLIAVVHTAFYDENNDGPQDIYSVKTRKIIIYSGLIAGASNALYAAFTKDFKSLDLGGIGVAIYHLISDIKYIREVKRDFILGKYDDKLKLNLDERVK